MDELRRVPVITKADLNTLDMDELLEGYLDGYGGEILCGNNRSRSYWHGFRNGQVDGGYAEGDYAQMLLAHDIYGRSMKKCA